MTTNQIKQNELDLERMLKFCSGDKNAFKELFFVYYAKLFWFVKHYVKSQETADAIVKELFIELWEKRESIDIHTSVKAYFYSAARNRSLNYIRSQTTFSTKFIIRSAEEEELELIKSTAKTPFEELEHKELAEAVNQAIEALPGKCKLIFTMNKYDGFKYSEIAKILEISIKTVENQIGRAFKILREKLAHFIPIFMLIAVELMRNINESISSQI